MAIRHEFTIGTDTCAFVMVDPSVLTRLAWATDGVEFVLGTRQEETTGLYATVPVGSDGRYRFIVTDSDADSIVPNRAPDSTGRAFEVESGTLRIGPPESIHEPVGSAGTVECSIPAGAYVIDGYYIPAEEAPDALKASGDDDVIAYLVAHLKPRPDEYEFPAPYYAKRAAAPKGCVLVLAGALPALGLHAFWRLFL